MVEHQTLEIKVIISPDLNLREDQDRKKLVDSNSNL